MRYIIFGAGNCGRLLAEKLSQTHEIICFVDNDSNKVGTHVLTGGGGGIPILPLGALLELDFDQCCVGTFTGFYEIPEQLQKMGIPFEKINTSFVAQSVLSREAFLEDWAKEFQHLPGSIAELGVYRGDFARKMNQAFPEKTLYLLDTFAGFSSEDIHHDERMGKILGAKHFANTSEELVLSKMPHVAQCKIVHGTFPQSASGIEENERFCWVNLDADLYAPILAGLRFFYPKMVEGGVILIHEYFSQGYRGVKKAVDEFMQENGLPFWQKMPIGDHLSVAIQKIPR